MTRCLLAVAMGLALVGPAAADLASIKSESKPVKRAEMALEYATAALKSAEDAYKVKGDLTQTNAALREVGESVELAYSSLKATGKNPSKSPKHFKRAEIQTRELLRRLGDFREEMSFEDRGVLDEVRTAVQKVHENLLEGIMGGKKI